MQGSPYSPPLMMCDIAQRMAGFEKHILTNLVSLFLDKLNLSEEKRD